MNEELKAQTMMIVENIFYALIDKMEETIFESWDEFEPFTNPVYSWVDSCGGTSTTRVVVAMEKNTGDTLARQMYMLSETDPVDPESLEDACGELANVVGGNLKAVLDDAGELTIPQVAEQMPWVAENPIVELKLNWKDNNLVISISDLADMPAE